MADLNALIAQGAQFQAMPDPFVQYGRMQQLEQGQQANQLNRMKMEEAQAASVERNALRGLNPTSPDYESQLFKVNPQLGIAYRKERTAAEAQQATQKAQQAQALKTNLDNYRSFLVGVNDQPAYDAWRDSVSKNIPELGNMLPPAFSAEVKDSLLKRAEDVSKQLTAAPIYQSAAPGATVLKDGVPVYTATEKTPAPPAMVAEYTFAKTPDGGGFQGTYQQFVTARAAAGRAPAAPRPEQPPVAVVDPVTGKPVYVTREQALSGKMTPASAQEGLPPKEIQKREAAFPQATSSIKGFETKSDSFIKDLKALRDDPGLENITGPVFGRTASVTREGSRAQALYDKIVAKGGFQALQDMRDASKTGGALGNVSNTEGKQLQASAAAIDRRQNSADVKAALDQLIGDIEVSKARMREAYDSTYSYKSTAPDAPKPGGGGALSPAEEAELAQLRKRFGK
tara:strand:+ start:781 stop:2148 length:1368 start_codon:yes stop_codon:yes gene_type:complete